jgi:hypothetical protein
MFTDTRKTANVVAALRNDDFLAMFDGATCGERRSAAGRALVDNTIDSYVAMFTDTRKTANAVAALDDTNFMGLYAGNTTADKRRAAGQQLSCASLGDWVRAFISGDRRDALVANLALVRSCSGLQFDMVRDNLSVNAELCRAMTIPRPLLTHIRCGIPVQREATIAFMSKPEAWLSGTSVSSSSARGPRGTKRDKRPTMKYNTTTTADDLREFCRKHDRYPTARNKDTGEAGEYSLARWALRQLKSDKSAASDNKRIIIILKNHFIRQDGRLFKNIVGAKYASVDWSS